MISLLKKTVLIMFSTFVFSGTAYATEQFNPVSSSFRMLWGLLVVLALIFVLHAILKKRVSGFSQNKKGAIKVLEVKHVLPKKTLMLVEIKGQEYIVGAGSDTISTIVPLAHTTSFSDFLDNTEEKAER